MTISNQIKKSALDFEARSPLQETRSSLPSLYLSKRKFVTFKQRVQQKDELQQQRSTVPDT